MSEPRGAAGADPAHRVRDAVGDDPPRAFATGDAQDRETLHAAKLRSLPRPSRLAAAKLTTLRGVGPKLAASAADAEIATLGDLLLRLPHSYRDRADVAEAAELKIGERATLMVEVSPGAPASHAAAKPQDRRGDRRGSLGPLKATWFNQAWLADKLVPGARLLIAGKLDRSGFRVETYEMLGRGRGPEGLHTTGSFHVPRHRAPARAEGPRVGVAGARLAADAIEPLPARVRVRHGMPGVADALTAHFPDSLIEAELARERLAFEELVLHQVALARRSERRASRPGIPLEASGGLVAAWIESLPFELTGDQRAAIADIDADPRLGSPDAAAADGRGGRRQDGRRARGDAALCRERRPGGADGADREMRSPSSTSRRSRPCSRARASDRRSSASTSAASRHALLGHLSSGRPARRRHARADRARGRVRPPRSCGVDEQHRFGVRQRAALDSRAPATRPCTPST